MQIAGRILKCTAIRPQYSSGLEWSQAGTMLHCLDYGLDTDHYSTSLTLSGSYADVIAVHTYLETHLAEIVTVTATEPMFGPHVIAGSQNVRVKTVEPPVLSFKDVATLEVSLLAVSPVLIADSQALDFSRVCIASITRSTEQRLAVGFTETATHGNRLGDTLYSATVTVKARAGTLGPMLKFLVGLRANSLAVTTSGTWLFESGAYSETVKITSVSNITPLDTGLTWWAVDLNLVRA